ncbi:hypothetical protein NDU88_004693 [Pleurodeles waltl]|uniref:Uncharacterized protein n=1 Tax=Pleurodeles waltl TaxID=8319 RepID=A0AAV7T981_PLEWA|nr:hypothetical protein NDU88_004693 [Pleurodeles waltl]
MDGRGMKGVEEMLREGSSDARDIKGVAEPGEHWLAQQPEGKSLLGTERAAGQHRGIQRRAPHVVGKGLTRRSSWAWMTTFRRCSQ